MFLRFCSVHVYNYIDLFWWLSRNPYHNRPILTNTTAPSVTTTDSPKPGTTATPVTVPQVSVPDGHPRLFALIIGINNYASVRKLSGAAPDAQAIKEYLENDLKVPSGQIRILLDKEATRSAIIQGFYELQNDPDIKMDDPILIFYAGHGSELDAPLEWETGAAGSKIQTLVPQDYDKTDGQEVHAIPDRTLGALIDGIAQKKGDNITVIFDCCHSGSGTRDDDDNETRTVKLASNMPVNLDQKVWSDSGASRATEIAPGFARTGLRSHVLLAACSSTETAKETGGRGVFTKALLTLLRRHGVEKLRYSDVLQRMDAIPSQNPQCEGFHHDRIFFNAKAPTAGRVSYPVHLEDGEYIMDAGSAHGISKGAEFTIFKDRDSILTSPPLGILEVADQEDISSFSTTLSLPLGKSLFQLDKGALALQTKVGAEEDLALHVPLDERLIPVFDGLLKQMQGTGPECKKISLVERADAQLEITVEGDKVVFNILDERVTIFGLNRIPFVVNPTVDDLYPIICAAAHYYWHLNRTQNNQLIQDKVEIKFMQLKKSQTEFDEAGRSKLIPIEQNLYHNGVIDFVVRKKAIYGIKITNNTPWDLYTSVFYFDNSDLSITPYYNIPPSGQFKQDVHLKEYGGILAIGYGSAGAVPFSYKLRDTQDVDVGFLKFFFTTKPVDFSKVPQASPFDNIRANADPEKDVVETWGSILIPVVQRRI
ncbi:hypothetical protein PILCRDRAFT_603746 [Piloderma croceum F 1598]|uniref:Peptidase C14 caspase domain-containing protein n=1 Tax=Piloderma croceum (strain F 1598) TaxID=765440 RepID=A0A0C3FDX9_PILCF|nr:hypothetical protein PILCRDRAFT_603746 [Piloderma croceum F 1598]